MAAFNRADASEVAGFYTKDAQLLPIHAGFIAGKKNIQGFWQAVNEQSLFTSGAIRF